MSPKCLLVRGAAESRRLGRCLSDRRALLRKVRWMLQNSRVLRGCLRRSALVRVAQSHEDLLQQQGRCRQVHPRVQQLPSPGKCRSGTGANPALVPPRSGLHAPQQCLSSAVRPPGTGRWSPTAGHLAGAAGRREPPNVARRAEVAGWPGECVPAAATRTSAPAARRRTAS